jgi:hypothetical protein
MIEADQKIINIVQEKPGIEEVFEQNRIKVFG